MMFQTVKSFSCPLVVVLLNIYSPHIQAEIYDITELQQPDTSSPAMTGFYTVTPEGKTTLEDPLESGFATSAGSDFNPERSAREASGADTSGKLAEKESRREKKNRETRTILVITRRKRPERNRADQFQCERHGFYYTNDGRCILPAYGHLPVMPQPETLPVPKRGMRTRVAD